MANTDNKVDQSPKATVTNPVVSGSKKPMNQKTWLALIAVLVLVLGAGVYLYGHNKSSSPLAANYAHNYKTLVDQKLPGEEAGRGLSFKRPVEIGAAENTLTNQGFVQLVKSLKDKTIYVDIGRIEASSKKFLLATAPSPTFLKSLNDTLTGDPNSADYKDTVKFAARFAQTGFKEPTIKVTAGNATAFTNSSVTANAWQFSVTATDSSGTTPTHTGKAVYLLGKNTTYLFMICAQSDNWQNNQSVFKQVFDSIKIDQ